MKYTSKPTATTARTTRTSETDDKENTGGPRPSVVEDRRLCLFHTCSREIERERESSCLPCSFPLVLAWRAAAADQWMGMTPSPTPPSWAHMLDAKFQTPLRGSNTSTELEQGKRRRRRRQHYHYVHRREQERAQNSPEIGDAVVAADGVESVAVGGQGHAAARHVHGGHGRPAAGARVVRLHRAQERRTVVAAARVQRPAQHGHAQPEDTPPPPTNQHTQVWQRL